MTGWPSTALRPWATSLATMSAPPATVMMQRIGRAGHADCAFAANDAARQAQAVTRLIDRADGFSVFDLFPLAARPAREPALLLELGLHVRAELLGRSAR